jgi:hypothetical protein
MATYVEVCESNHVWYYGTAFTTHGNNVKVEFMQVNLSTEWLRCWQDTWFVWMQTFMTNPALMYAWHCMDCDAGHVQILQMFWRWQRFEMPVIEGTVLCLS